MKKLVLLVGLLLFLSACQSPEDQNSQPYLEKIDYALGTVVRIKLYDNQDPAVMDRIMARLHEIEERMSYTLEGSDIYRLNHADGEPVELHPDTLTVLKEAIRFNEISGGTFDPTLGVLIDAWAIGSDRARIPSQAEIDQGLTTIGVDKVHFLDGNQVRLEPGTEIDLGAIAKGFAADEVARICHEHGVESAIIDLGGNVLVVGSKSGADFVVGIRDPFAGTNTPLGTLGVQSQTIVTSGDYERFLEVDGRRYHHILDYQTGYPVESDLASVSIITDRSIEADGYSTSVYAMGLQKGKDFIESKENLEAIFVTKDKHVIISNGLKNIFKLTDTSFTLVE
ncbi:MAG TPA: FAD:protein FMN transferase [Tissierellia bacterium]|nr:FAD:protein FMN transferase [Tissierellia bacterium]